MNDVKQLSQKAYDEKRYADAINKALELGIPDFVDFLKKQKSWLLNSDFIKTLFSENSKVFSDLFSNEFSDELLHEYFKYSEHLPCFENKLAAEFPELFVKSVRLNTAFLCSNRLEQYSKINLPDDLQIHIEVWKKLYMQEISLWGEVEREMDALIQSGLEMDIVLSNTIKILSSSGSQNSDQIQALSYFYSVFIELFLYRAPQEKIELSSKENFLKTFSESQKFPINQIIEKLLTNINKWVSFKDSFLYPYCYDLKIVPKSENKIVYFERNPEDHYKWELDGLRYNALRIDYSSDLKLFLSDLKIENFTFGKKKIPVHSLYNPLFLASKKRENPNFFLMSQEEYLKLNDFALAHLPEELINLFSEKKKKKTKFDQFKLQYNVWEKPFLQLGNYLFCPTIFLANNDWFYGFPQAGLKNLSQKQSNNERIESAHCMEKDLGKILEEKDWKVFISENSNIFRDNGGGDVDIIVSDKDTSILIQLKRTKFRLDLKEAYFDSINIDRCAAKQLNNAEKYLQKPDNEICQLQNNVQKWIVSTSFENTLTKINGCLKVNYFDLLQSLGIAKNSTLKDLIAFIETDGWMKMKMLCGLKIPLANPRAYRQAFSFEKGDCIEYIKRYNEACDLNEKGDKKKAAEILLSCLAENPTDTDVLDALGNTYADLKMYDESLQYFEKAIDIIPNDPYFLRQIVLTLRDAKKEDKKYTSLCQNLYWYVNFE